MDIRFQQVETETQKREAGELIREYLDSLNDRLLRDYGMHFDVDAMVQSDLSDPHKFHPPYGRFYLAQYMDKTVGVGCLKRLDNAVANRLIADARSIGYRQLRLESLEFLDAAHALYGSLGFRRVDPYAHNSMEAYQPPGQLDHYYSITVFMEMDL